MSHHVRERSAFDELEKSEAPFLIGASLRAEGLPPSQKVMEKFKGAHRVDSMRSVKIFNSRSVGKIDAIIVSFDLGVFVSNPRVNGDGIAVTSFDHEWTRRHEVGHLTVVETVPEIKFGHFVFVSKNVSERPIVAADLPDPLVEIAGTDRQAILIEQGRDADRRFTPIGKAIKSNSLSVHKRLLAQPIKQSLVLAQNERKKGEFEGVRESLQLAKLFSSNIRILRAIDYKTVVHKVCGQLMIVVFVFKRGLDHVLGPILQPMLANDDGSALTGAQGFRQKQNSICVDLGPEG